MKFEIATPQSRTFPNGQLVRVPEQCWGARFEHMQVPRELLKNAFGYLRGERVNGVAQYFIEMHDLMPADFQALGKILVPADATIEGVHLDHPGEAGMLALPYLSAMGDIIRTRMNNGTNTEAAMATLSATVKAQIKPTMDRIMVALGEAGYQVVREETVKTTITTKLHIVADAEAAKQRISEGLDPEEGKVYKLGKVKDLTTKVTIKPLADLEAMAYGPRVSDNQDHIAQAEEHGLSPFMQMLAGYDMPDIETSDAREALDMDDGVGVNDVLGTADRMDGPVDGDDEGGDDMFAPTQPNGH